MRILVVDDEKIKRVTLADDLSGQGHEVVTAADGQQALELLDRELFDVVVTDIKMPRLDGLELLKRIKEGTSADVRFILMTAYGSIPVAVEAMKLGAADFVTKPFRNEDLFPIIQRIAEERREAGDEPADVTAEDEVDQEIIGQSESMQRVKRMIRISARTDANVLLCGETGTGKDLLAGVIHRNSHRNRGPLVKVGCTLLPATLIESELYGHEEGSFTGAEQARKGRFELAEGGTIYLDDVDDIPLDQQAKLLRAIEEKVFERVGGTRPIKANVRIVASTKLNLLDKIAIGAFRQDLYYRLDVLRIRLPPLRERREDIPALTERLLRRLAGNSGYDLDPQAVPILKQHDWPGNVRELYHTLERALLVGGGQITPDLLEAEIGGLPSESEPRNGLLGHPAAGGFKAAMDHAEKQLLLNALEACGGNKTAAAQSLGMKPSTFRDKLAKHGLK
ncbi:MAG: sigma-54-dependent Fis family transcriptional regulator [Candidatus Anammoximicrobium sp.]|nr:sigma-54-dependent Fis family transcriptional regulator [Candidatus Anammoximicrobium sp.]